MTEKKLDWDKPLQTTDGHDAKVVSRDYWQGGEICFVVQVHSPATHMYNGDSYLKVVDPKTGVGMGINLRNKTRKVTKWYNLYADRPGFVYFDNEDNQIYCYQFEY